MSGSTCGGAAEASCPSQDKLTANLNGIKNKVVVLSGKGGVGKSTVATNLAVGLSLAGFNVGLLDVDVHGPSVPHLLKLAGVVPGFEDGVLQPVPWSDKLGVMSVGFLVESRNDPVIWRGPRKTGVIEQFMREVNWGARDFLVVDCPPGTGDEPLSVLQRLQPDAKVVVVTTPQQVAIADVRRSISFCRALGAPIIGLVENMSGYACPHCGKVEELFSADGGVDLCAEMGVPFLGRIPIDPMLMRDGDQGNPFVAQGRANPTAEALQAIVGKISAGAKA